METDAASDIQNAKSELDEILGQISDLDKWREIFNSRGLELQNSTIKRPFEKGKPEEESEDGSGRPLCSGQTPAGASAQLSVPYSVPRALTVSTSLGGLPISPEVAVKLRRILFGNTFHIFNYEWKKSFFKFREPYSDLSYALEAERGGSRAIQMVVQGNIIKYLLFTRHTGSNCHPVQSLAEVSEKEQERALATALTDILWTAGSQKAAIVSLVTLEYSFTPQLDYKPDNFTERFKEEGSHGVILFLYSLILSRTIDRVRDDLESSTSHLLHLSLGNFVCRQALLNLLLTGRASPNVFNGTLQFDEGGIPLEKPLHGVLARSDVGYLHWNRELVEHAKLPVVGSMLKTPRFPIWVCSINGTYSVLFSSNRSLLSDWKMEHLFDLCFYNGQPSQKSTVLLTIDTHSHHWEVGHPDTQGDPEKRFPSVEMTIRTKWEGAAINWNGTIPFF